MIIFEEAVRFIGVLTVEMFYQPVISALPLSIRPVP